MYYIAYLYVLCSTIRSFVMAPKYINNKLKLIVVQPKYINTYTQCTLWLLCILLLCIHVASNSSRRRLRRRCRRCVAVFRFLFLSTKPNALSFPLPFIKLCSVLYLQSICYVHIALHRCSSMGMYMNFHSSPQHAITINFLFLSVSRLRQPPLLTYLPKATHPHTTSVRILFFLFGLCCEIVCAVFLCFVAFFMCKYRKCLMYFVQTPHNICRISVCNVERSEKKKVFVPFGCFIRTKLPYMTPSCLYTYITSPASIMHRQWYTLCAGTWRDRYMRCIRVYLLSYT